MAHHHDAILVLIAPRVSDASSDPVLMATIESYVELITEKMDDTIECVHAVQFLARALRRRLGAAKTLVQDGARLPRSLEDLYFAIRNDEDFGPSVRKRRRCETTKAATRPPRRRAPTKQSVPTEPQRPLRGLEDLYVPITDEEDTEETASMSRSNQAPNRPTQHARASVINNELSPHKHAQDNDDDDSPAVVPTHVMDDDDS